MYVVHLLAWLTVGFHCKFKTKHFSILISQSKCCYERFMNKSVYELQIYEVVQSA